MNPPSLVTSVDARLAELDAPEPVLDAWRVVRGFLRRSDRHSQTLPSLEDEEPITAKHHFQAANKLLKPEGE